MINFNKTGKKQISREEIETRAYEIYLQRRGTNGTELEDWLTAERELIAAQEQSETAENANVLLHGRSSMSAEPEDVRSTKLRRSTAAGDRSSS